MSSYAHPLNVVVASSAQFMPSYAHVDRVVMHRVGGYV
jgi:hypothetical protein